MVERPRLFALLDRGATGPVTLVSAPAGSGKTMLVSSWLRSASPKDAVAWVSVERDESDTTHMWLTIMDALRDSGAITPGDPLATLTPAPLGGQEEFFRRLIDGLRQLPRTVYLILDDLHHLRSADGMSSVEHLLTRAPAQLRTFVLSRHDPKLGLHRLRLSGELTEIRAADLEFTDAEAAELMAAAGITVEAAQVARLRERTEGWAAGLRLAALSLRRHADPAAFVAEFSGSERTVADYLVGEVLTSQPREVRDLLLRTCILERVNGPLADLLTGRTDGARLLHELEEANAFVVAADVARSWFRYHHLLADLLRLELRREAPAEIPLLHRLAAGWYAEHGYVVDGVRHAQLGQDWGVAAELVGRQWVHLVLDGEEATLGSLLAGFPVKLAQTDAEIATIAAAGRMAEARWRDADALLAAAQRAMANVPPDRRRRAETALATAQLFRARRLGDMEPVVDAAAAMLHVDAPVELRALALLNLGIVETWTLRLGDAEEHLEQGLALGQETGRPYLEVGCLAALGVVANLTQRFDLGEDRVREAIAIADRVGWTTHPMVGVAYMSLGWVLIDRGLSTEGEQWLDRADAILTDAPEPAARVALRQVQGMYAFGRGRFGDALAAFRDTERLAQQLRASHFLAAVARPWQLRAQLRLGDTQAVRAALTGAGDSADWCNIAAHLCLADNDARGAADAVAPVLAGTAFAVHVNIVIESLILDAIARKALGETEAARLSVERVLALTEPQGRVWMVLTVPGVRALLEAHPMHRTAHGGHLKTLLDHLAGIEPAAPTQAELLDPLSERELAVLRLLPTNLSAGEIGNELFLSVHTVKTHMRKLYAKLDAHARAEAVQRGRALGLLAPARRGR
jgi:LuxR family transcriptional regulator, maltose regulon positive regulatory protein